MGSVREKSNTNTLFWVALLMLSYNLLLLPVYSVATTDLSLAPTPFSGSYSHGPSSGGQSNFISPPSSGGQSNCISPPASDSGSSGSGHYYPSPTLTPPSVEGYYNPPLVLFPPSGTGGSYNPPLVSSHRPSSTGGRGIVDNPPLVPSPPSDDGGIYNYTPVVPAPPSGSGGGGSYNNPPLVLSPPSSSGGGCVCPEPSSPPPSSGGSGGYYRPPRHPRIPLLPSPPRIPVNPLPSTPLVPSPPYTTPTPIVPIAPSPPLVPFPRSPPTPFYPYTPPFPSTYWGENPAMVVGVLGGWATIGGIMGVTTLPGLSSSTSLQQVLNRPAKDGYGSLYREGAASYLNSIASKKFYYSTNQVKHCFLTSLTSDKTAARQASLFRLANEGYIKN